MPRILRQFSGVSARESSVVASTEKAGNRRRHRKVVKVGDDRPIIKWSRENNAAHEKKAAEMGLGFRIVGASILHRYPVITKDPLPWELEKQEMDDAIAAKQKEYFNKLIDGTDAAKMVPSEGMSMDNIMKTMPFEPRSRTTQADTEKNHKTTDRALQDSLYLLVRRNRAPGPDGKAAYEWQFPQGKAAEGESMRETAERVGDRAYGKVSRWYISNAPMGHLCYAYPAEMQAARKQYGAKVFFYRCQLLDEAGQFRLETRLYKDYVWVTRDEVCEYMDPETAAYMKALLVE